MYESTLGHVAPIPFIVSMHPYSAVVTPANSYNEGTLHKYSLTVVSDSRYAGYIRPVNMNTLSDATVGDNTVFYSIMIGVAV